MNWFIPEPEQYNEKKRPFGKFKPNIIDEKIYEDEEDIFNELSGFKEDEGIPEED